MLTDEIRETLVACDGPPSSSSTPEELTQRLRSVASRARKSVTEGYRTSPSFTKAHSTGAIFQSMNDTMREVYSNLKANADATDNLPSRKRSRSVTEDDERDFFTQDSEMPVDVEQKAGIILPQPGGTLPFTRPTKGLRTSRHSLLETRSLPNGSFSFGRGMDLGSEANKSASINEENDWSAESTFQPSEQGFDPMIL